MIMQIFNSPARSFEAAIKSGLLSRDENAANFAGNYMYMYHENGKAYFKNSITRDYLIG